MFSASCNKHKICRSSPGQDSASSSSCSCNKHKIKIAGLSPAVQDIFKLLTFLAFSLIKNKSHWSHQTQNILQSKYLNIKILL